VSCGGPPSPRLLPTVAVWLRESSPTVGSTRGSLRRLRDGLHKVRRLGLKLQGVAEEDFL
jgi:hypothetical protein